MIRRALLFCLGSVLAGCAGTETGNPSIDTQIALTAHSSDHARVAIRVSEGGLVVDRAWLSLGSVALLAGNDCTATSRRFSTAPLGTADHTSGPEVAALAAEVGDYCGLGVRFEAALIAPLEAPALLGHSVLLEGHLADGSAFSLASPRATEVRVAALAGSFALDDERFALLLGFDLATWLSRTDFTTATREADGSVRVDETHNPDLLDSFETELAAGLELYRDRDADTALDTNPELLGRGSD